MPIGDGHGSWIMVLACRGSSHSGTKESNPLRVTSVPSAGDGQIDLKTYEDASDGRREQETHSLDDSGHSLVQDTP
jgi:hypothetical protein